MYISTAWEYLTDTSKFVNSLLRILKYR